MEKHLEETDGGIETVEMTRRIRDERYERGKEHDPGGAARTQSERERGRPRTVPEAHPEPGRGSILNAPTISKCAAYTSADVEPSHVITAMHDEQRAHSSIRISVGRANDEEQIDKAARRIASAAEQLRAFAL